MKSVCDHNDPSRRRISIACDGLGYLGVASPVGKLGTEGVERVGRWRGR